MWLSPLSAASRMFNHLSRYRVQEQIGVWSLSLKSKSSYLVSKLQTIHSRSVSAESSGTKSEKKLVQLLRVRFPNASEIYVADVSGGCGAMFDVTVISPEFKDISLVKQHRLINDALKDEIKQMHGLRISTFHERISS